MCRILTFAKHFQALSCIDTRALGRPEVERPYQPLSWGSQKPGSLSCCLPNSHIQPMSRFPPIFPLTHLSNLLTPSYCHHYHSMSKSLTPLPTRLQWCSNRAANIHSGFLCSFQTVFSFFLFFFTSKMKIWSCSSVISDTSGVFHLRLRWQLNPSLWLTRLCRGLSPPASAGFALTVLLLSLDLSAVLEFL